MAKEKLYHGTSVLFDIFDLAHALEGDGKIKFGYGIYLTQVFKTAAYYSGAGKGKDADTHYVYTVEAPEMKEDNHLWSNKPVHPAIVERAQEKLDEIIPQEVTTEGKLFRKYIGNRLIGMKGTTKKLSKSAGLEAEKAASAFLLGIGVEMLVWPYNQSKPDGEQNRAILDPDSVHLVQITLVLLDNKGHLIPGSETIVRKF